MTQKVIASIYKRTITKTYDEKGNFICNYVLEYRDENDNGHKMSVFQKGQEPIINQNDTFYLVELVVYSKQNVTYNNNRVYNNVVQVLSITPLRDEEDMRMAKEIIYQHYQQVWTE